MPAAVDAAFTKTGGGGRRSRSLADFAARAALSACLALAPTPAAPEALALATRPIPLNPELPEAKQVGALAYRGGLVLRSDHPRFGGLSGLAVAADGRLIAVSDRGVWIGFRPVVDGGQLVGVAEATIDPILDGNGRPLTGRAIDAEAVVVLRNAVFVAFEQDHRVWRYPGPPHHAAGAAKATMPIPERGRLAPNGGFEAVTALGGGRLLMVAEEPATDGGDHPGWIVAGDRAFALTYAPTGLFKPTEFARLRNGDVLALERRFTAVGGFAARIQRIARADIRPGARLKGREVARIEPPLIVDNYEAMAAVPAPDGGHLVFIASDNNFRSLQHTVLLLFHLPD
jgi:hypothetical protein